MTGLNTSITTQPINDALTHWKNPEEQLEGSSICPEQRGFNLHPATGAYSLLYCLISTVPSGIPDFLPSGNPDFLAPGLQGECFINQITSEIYTYDYANKLCISSDDIDPDMTEDLQRLLQFQNQKVVKNYGSGLNISNSHKLTNGIQNEGQDIIF